MTSERPVAAVPAFSQRFLDVLRYQPVRYVLVGVLNTAWGFTLFTVLIVALDIWYPAALVVSHVVAVSTAFLLYRYLVFHVAGSAWLDFVRCHGVYLVQLVVKTALLVVLAEAFSVPPVPAMALTIITTMIVSFYGHKHVSFRR